MIILNYIDLTYMAALIAVAGGASVALTCTSAGYPLRFVWCALLRPRRLRWLWKLVRCPHCNSFWTGLVVGALSGFTVARCVAQALATLLTIFVVQHALLALGHDITPEEDMESILGLETENDDGA